MLEWLLIHYLNDRPNVVPREKIEKGKYVDSSSETTRFVLEQSFMRAIIAAASGKREVIVNSKGRECLREGESVVFVAKYE